MGTRSKQSTLEIPRISEWGSGSRKNPILKLPLVVEYCYEVQISLNSELWPEICFLLQPIIIFSWISGFFSWKILWNSEIGSFLFFFIFTIPESAIRFICHWHFFWIFSHAMIIYNCNSSRGNFQYRSNILILQKMFIGANVLRWWYFRFNVAFRRRKCGIKALDARRIWHRMTKTPYSRLSQGWKYLNKPADLNNF